MCGLRLTAARFIGGGCMKGNAPMKPRYGALALSCVLMTAHGTNAATRLPLGSPTTVNGVEAVCTGVGLDARQDPRWNSYPLKIEVAGKDGQYLGDVRVTILRDGHPIIEAECSGPWLLFRLTPGGYEVQAETEQKMTRSRALVPASGQGRVVLRFPDLGGAITTPGPSPG